MEYFDNKENSLYISNFVNNVFVHTLDVCFFLVIIPWIIRSVKIEYYILIYYINKIYAVIKNGFRK